MVLKGGPLNTNRLGYAIIALVLLIEIPRFYGAYSAIDVSWIPSVGTGIVLPLGAGYVFHAWWKVDHQRKGRNVLLFWFGALMVLEPVILVPWGISQLRSVPLATVVVPGAWEVVWITVVMMSPFFMTAAVVNGLALQKTPKVTHNESNVERTTYKEKAPETRDEFIKLVKKDPGILDKSSTEVKKQFSIPACQKTVYNWIQYAKEHDGYHAEPVTAK